MGNELDTPKNIVVASNQLFRCRNKLKDILAGRIFMAFVSLVDDNAVANNGNFFEYKISASAILDKNTGGDNYRQIKEAAYSLIDQKIERKTGPKSFKLYTLFSTIEYNNGVIIGEFHKELKPFFIKAKGEYTIIHLKDFFALPSIYSQRIFSLLKSWDDKPEVTIPVEDLHFILETPESIRKNFSELRRWVLEKAHKDITSRTNLQFEFEPIKTGRKVTAIRFVFAKKRALPVAKKKAEAKQKATSKQHNRDFLDAVECWKNQESQTCLGGHRSQAVCDLCQQLVQAGTKVE